MIKYYVVDAFADMPFHGNPAGVCLLDKWINDAVMQQIAFENNLAETAFLLKQNGYYDLRWFTPKVEIDLCGHATLGSAFILMNYVDPSLKHVDFHTKSGLLSVTRTGDIYSMNFPSRKAIPCAKPTVLEKALGINVKATFQSRDLLVLLENEFEVANLHPNLSLLAEVKNSFGIIVTARSSSCDFVSRFFVPNAGIDEDPVTGSSHCTLIPFWSEKLHKKDMIAHQLSTRGGILICKDCGDRVSIGGRAVCYLIGNINI
ncbi:PhzF family phenazine biosynthesis protein [Caproicibacterium sp. NSD3]